MTSIDKLMRQTENREKFAYDIEARTQKYVDLPLIKLF